MERADNAAPRRERLKFRDLAVALASEPTLSPTVKQQISELGEAEITQDNKRMYWFKLKDLVGKERLHTAAAVLSRPILPVVDRKRSARLVGAQQASTTAPLQLKGSRRRKRAAPHNQEWRPNAKADRPKNRRCIELRINKFVASGDYAGERDPPRIVRIMQVCKRASEWYENVHWGQAVSWEDYRERLTNNFKELEDEVISCLPPRVIENAMPQLSVPFIVDKLKEFAVSSTHKELDRIQSEFTTQASSPAPTNPFTPHPKHPTYSSHARAQCFLQDDATGIPHETQISQGLQGAYDLSLVSGPPPGCVCPPPPPPISVTERPLSRRAAKGRAVASCREESLPPGASVSLPPRIRTVCERSRAPRVSQPGTLGSAQGVQVQHCVNTHRPTQPDTRVSDQVASLVG